MKRKLFLGTAMCVGMTMLAGVNQPKVKDFTEFMTLDLNLKFEMPMNVRWLEPGIRGCVADLNGDGIDDFILTGLWAESGDALVDNDAVVSKNFLQVYLGQKDATPVLAYEDKDFEVAGNGAIDCTKLEDGSWLLAVQGGVDGVWSATFVANVYNLSVNGNEVKLNLIDGEDYLQLDMGAGRGSLLFLDVNDDGFEDLFQLGWKDSQTYTNVVNLYVNDGSNAWFDMESSMDFRLAANTFAEKADFNKDGKMDIIYPVQNGGGLYVYMNNGDGSFNEVLITSFLPEEREDGYGFIGEDDAIQATAIDFNGDGFPDIALMATVTSTTPWMFPLFLYQNNGDGTFTELKKMDGEEQVYLEGGQRGDFAVGDFNLDGHQDIIFSAEVGREKAEGGLSWATRSFVCLGDGTGNFEQYEVSRTETTPNGLEPMCRRGNFGRMLTGDFDGNNSLDIVTAGCRYADGLNEAKKIELRLHRNVKEGTPESGICQQVEDNVAVFYSGKSLFVNNAAGATYTLYTLTGASIYSGVISSSQETIDLDVAEGIYMLKINNHVQKVVLR